MPDIVISITDIEDKILKRFKIDPTTWLKHALREKIRSRVNDLISTNTNYNPTKLNTQEKLNILQSIINGG